MLTADRRDSLHQAAPRRSIVLNLSERRLVLYSADVLGIVAALGIALKTSEVDPSPMWFVWVGLLIAVWTLNASVFDVYDLRTASRLLRSALVTYRALFATFIAYLAIPYWSAPLLMSRLSILIWILCSLLFVSVGRAAYARLLIQPRFHRRALIVGTGAAAITAAEMLVGEAADEYAVVGFIAREPESSPVDGIQMVGTYDNLLGIAREFDVAEVVLADDFGLATDLAPAIVSLYESGVEVRLMSALYEEITGRIPVRHISTHWFAVLPERAGGGRMYGLVKRLVDVAVATLLLVCLSPIMVIIALAVGVDSHGSPLYRQERLGYLSRPFFLVKFRTMINEAEPNGPQWATKQDSRRTRLGQLLRPTRLDELPQLWNVLRGDMTLIGPRPERAALISQIEQEVPFYRVRLLVRPGITGWAQVRHPYANSVSGSVDKLQYDLYYVKHRSAYLDLVIAFKTLGVIARASGS